MTRLLEILVALAIVFVLAVLFAVALPNHRHIDRSVEVSAPARQIFDVVDGFPHVPFVECVARVRSGSSTELRRSADGRGCGSHVDQHRQAHRQR